MGRPQGIPEVPSSPDWLALRRYLVEMRNAMVRLQASVLPPGVVNNLRATAKALGVIIDFTRSDGDAYTLYYNTLPSNNGATRIDLGMANSYTHDIGEEGKTFYYWIKPKKGQSEGEIAGPVKATTLAAGAVIVTPKPTTGSMYPARYDESGGILPGRPTGSYYEVP